MFFLVFIEKCDHFRQETAWGNATNLILYDYYNFIDEERVVLTGGSAGGKGAAGNCNTVGDEVKRTNPNVDFRCIADASGWIPLPVYNTTECDTLSREHDSTELWQRQIDPACTEKVQALGH